MNARRLGVSGPQSSVVGLGCNGFGSRTPLDAARKVVHAALDSGVTLFDTADVYGNRFGHPSASELYLGQLLGDRRKDILLATKFGNPRMEYDNGLRGASRAAVMCAIEGSLKRLNTGWIDLYQLHMPDPGTRIEETLRALDDLIRQGKIRYIGCSNFAAWQVVEAQLTAKHLGLDAFVTCQNEYSLLAREPERELLPAMQKYGLALLPYFPLAAGLLSGRYRRGSPPPAGARLVDTNRLAKRYMTERNWDAVERLQQFCVQRGRTLLELAFGWLLAQPAVCSVIAGATTPEQVKANVQAAGAVFTTDECAEVNALCKSAEYHLAA